MPLFIAGTITVAVTVILFYVNGLPQFKDKGKIIKQIVAGLAFAGCAIYATEIGSFEVNGAALNCRDAAPILSGLLFGPWAGIITGVIGGVERYFASWHGVGTYTQIACASACIMAGLTAALCKVTIFKKERPTSLHAIVLVAVIEAVHMGLVPLTHLNDLEQATLIMYNVFLPLLVSNAIAVLIAFMITSLIYQRRLGIPYITIITRPSNVFQKNLFYSFQFWLLCVVVLCFTATMVVSNLVFDTLNYQSAEQESLDELDTITAIIVKEALYDGRSETEVAIDFAKQWSEQNQENGLENNLWFMVVTDDLSQAYGYDPYGEIGQHLVGLEEGKLHYVACKNSETGKDVPLTVLYKHKNGYYGVMFMLEKYSMYLPHMAIAATTTIELLIFGFLMLTIFILLRRLVSQNLDKVNGSLEKITQGDLDEKVSVYSHEEFAHLSDSINATVDELKRYIEKEANRFTKDFELAQQIQHSALPQTFPENEYYDIYASYDAAKNVGGDFYDFYDIDDSHLGFLIADVSGKGIPAAMFMMQAKSSLHEAMQVMTEPSDILDFSNNFLCDNNEADMFVTCWLGILNTKTGVLKYANAGHNPPIVKRTGERCILLDKTPGLVLGALPNMKYKTYKQIIQDDDLIFLFTDGVTEAVNEKVELYGDERLQHKIEEAGDLNSWEAIKYICDDVADFVGDAEQADDITMLALKYYSHKDGKWRVVNGMRGEITVEGKISQQQKIIDYLEPKMMQAHVPMAISMKLGVAIDEIFSNICNHGYADTPGFITFRYKIMTEAVKDGEDKHLLWLSFIDEAPQFNPLETDDPDTTSAAEDREIGGLGLFMVKNMMDHVIYAYEGGYNRLNLIKYFEPEAPDA